MHRLLDRPGRFRPGLGDRVLRCRGRGLAAARRGLATERETRAVRLIGVTFFALAALPRRRGHPRPGQPRPSRAVRRPGLAVTAAALVVMPALAVAKRRTGQALGSRTLIADSAETAFCAFTSAATLGRHRPERLAGLVVGRPGRRPGHRRPGGQGRPRSLGRRRLTRTRFARRSGRKSSCTMYRIPGAPLHGLWGPAEESPARPAATADRLNAPSRIRPAVGGERTLSNSHPPRSGAPFHARINPRPARDRAGQRAWTGSTSGRPERSGPGLFPRPPRAGP